MEESKEENEIPTPSAPPETPPPPPPTAPAPQSYIENLLATMNGDHALVFKFNPFTEDHLERLNSSDHAFINSKLELISSLMGYDKPANESTSCHVLSWYIGMKGSLGLLIQLLEIAELEETGAHLKKIAEQVFEIDVETSDLLEQQEKERKERIAEERELKLIEEDLRELDRKQNERSLYGFTLLPRKRQKRDLNSSTSSNSKNKEEEEEEEEEKDPNELKIVESVNKLISSRPPTPNPENTTATPTTAAPNENFQCKICYERELRIIFIPCGHLYMCAQCSRTYKGKQCPVCRAPIIKRMNVYK